MMFDQDFQMVAGDTAILKIPMKDKNGEPYPLEGCHITWVMKDKWNGGEVVLTLTDLDSITVLEPASSGLIEVHIDPADTRDIVPRTYFHGCVITNGTNVYSALVGTLVLYPKIV
jgi:hypothetical protein